MYRIYRLWIPVAGWAGLIYVLSSVPHLRSNLPFDFILRKIGHVIEYALLTYLIFRAFRHTFMLTQLDLLVYPVFLSICYAVLDEYHQSFVPGRRGAWQDIMIDSVGILGTYLVLYCINHFNTSKTKKSF